MQEHTLAARIAATTAARRMAPSTQIPATCYPRRWHPIETIVLRAHAVQSRSYAGGVCGPSPPLGCSMPHLGLSFRRIPARDEWHELHQNPAKGGRHNRTTSVQGPRTPESVWTPTSGVRRAPLDRTHARGIDSADALCGGRSGATAPCSRCASALAQARCLANRLAPRLGRVKLRQPVALAQRRELPSSARRALADGGPLSYSPAPAENQSAWEPDLAAGASGACGGSAKKRMSE